MAERNEYQVNNLLLVRDELDRITVECVCGQKQQIEDVMQLMYLRSLLFGRIRGTVLTVRNVLRSMRFASKHRACGGVSNGA